MVRSILLIALVPLSAWGTELRPWYGNAFEFNWDIDATYQTYREVAVNSRDEQYSSDDYFFHTGVNTAFGEELAAEVEITAASTRHHRRFLDNLRITGRYLLADDIAGDPISLVVGVTGTQAFAISVDDISSFHHGKLEGEIHVALGRETACGSDWGSRWWILGAIGSADVGSPWWRAQMTGEYHFLQRHAIAVFAYALGGLGHDTIDIEDFHGYGPIRHLSVDVGFRYTFEIDFFGSLYLEYLNRVYARNFPAHANIVRLALHI